MDKRAILDFLSANKRKFQKKYNIERFILFGSYAKNTPKRESDVDLLYTLKDGYSLDYRSYLEFEDELRRAFDTKVDLINEKKLNPIIKIDAEKDFIYV